MNALVRIVLLIAACFLTHPAFAQRYPSKPIHIIVGQPAGGGMDTLARLLEQKLAASLGQAVIVENKPGAGGVIGAGYVAKAPADGYTLLLAPIGTIVFTQILNSKLPYSALRDFTPVSMISDSPLLLLVNAKQPFTSVQDLVAFMRANPEKSNYGGSSPSFQVASELFKAKTGTKAEFVQYKGTNETILGITSGDLLFALTDTGPAAPLLAAGRLRALAVTSPRRLATLPNVPTMAEAGLPDMNLQFWAGIFAPAGTPPAIVKKLEAEINRIIGLPDVRERMETIHVNPIGTTSEEFAAAIAGDLTRWSEVAKKANIKASD